MGTRSLTVFMGESGLEIGVLYRQMDGYPDGHGAELAEFLSGMKIVNGFDSRQKHKIANGMGCLSAQVIAHFKTEVGGFYLMPAGTRDADEEFIYVISEGEQEPNIEVQSGDGTQLFVGPASETLIWCKNPPEET